MRRSKVYTGIAVLIILAAVMAVLHASSATAQRTPPKLRITLKDNSITIPAQPMRAGEYQVVVKNFSHRARGVQLTGKDRAGSDYVRYSDILPSGATGMFTWYFPSGRSVTVKDVASCKKDSNSCIKPEYAGHSATLRFR